MERRPEVIYRGGVWFHITRFIVWVIALSVGASALVFLAMAVSILLDGSVVRDADARLLAVAGFPLGIYGLALLCQWICGLTEIGVSENAIWYRFLFRWRPLWWKDVTGIISARSGDENGIYIYSSSLPFPYRYVTMGRLRSRRMFPPPFENRGGKAIFVSALLRQYDDLLAQLYHLWRTWMS